MNEEQSGHDESIVDILCNSLFEALLDCFNDVCLRCTDAEKNN